VAEFVTGHGDLGSLGALHRASRDINEGTLPVLYETVRLHREKRIERFAKPRGWKYTK
jgi:hypothetical protein